MNFTRGFQGSSFVANELSDTWARGLWIRRDWVRQWAHGQVPGGCGGRCQIRFTRAEHKRKRRLSARRCPSIGGTRSAACNETRTRREPLVPLRTSRKGGRMPMPTCARGLRALWRKVQACTGVSDDFFHGSQF